MQIFDTQKTIRILLFILLSVISTTYPDARLESITHPNARIAIISITTEDADRLKFNGMSKTSLQKYANKWGYDLHYYTGVLDPSRAPAWSKIPAFQQHISSEKYDWLVWIDDDMIITNPEIKLEIFIEKYGENKNFIVQTDHYYGSTANTGIFFLRKCDWGNAFLKAVYEHPQKTNNLGSLHHGTWEQGSIASLIGSSQYKEKAIILQHKVLQGFDNPDWRWQMTPFKKMIHLKWAPGDFIMHVSGQDGNTRRQRMSDVIKALNL